MVALRFLVPVQSGRFRSPRPGGSRSGPWRKGSSMELWRNAKLRTKVGTGLLVATVGLAGFAVTLVVGKQGDLGAADQVVTVTTLSTKVGNLLHETQRERGRTAQFTSSRGAKFGPELAAQQKVTDQRLADYRGFLAAHRDLPGDLRAAVDRLDGALDTLAGLRSQAAALPASPATGIGGHTRLNRALLATIAAAAAQNRNPTIGVRLQAYLALLSAKEDTGLERAQLTRVFTADRFAAGQFATVLSLMASQKAYLTVFERAAGADVLKRWAEIRDSAVFKQVADLEQVAVNRAASGQFGVDSGVWFDAVTQKIDLYKQLEDLQAAGILALARGAGSEASAGAVTALVAAVVLLLVTVLIGIAVIVSITRPLKQVTTVAEQIAVGDVSGVVSYRSRGEGGQLAHSFRRPC